MHYKIHNTEEKTLIYFLRQYVHYMELSLFSLVWLENHLNTTFIILCIYSGKWMTMLIPAVIFPDIISGGFCVSDKPCTGQFWLNVSQQNARNGLQKELWMSKHDNWSYVNWLHKILWTYTISFAAEKKYMKGTFQKSNICRGRQ